MPFPNEHAARQTEPGQYDEFRRQHPEGFPVGIDAIFGIKTVEGKRVSEIQTLRANKDKWTVSQFRKWLEEHDFKTTIEEATGDTSDKHICCDKLIEHLHDAKGFRQDGNRFFVDGVMRYDRLGRLAIDREAGEGEIEATTTEEGFLRVEGGVARTGVQAYTDKDGNTWREYRPADEVFSPESMDSFRLVILTEGHPTEMVTIDNVKDVYVGHGGEPRRTDDDIMATGFLITDADAIKSAKDGSAVELSAGYKADVLLEGGVSPDGEEFDAIQTNIRGNHVAKVDQGRCGPECRLLMRGDAVQTTNDNPKGDIMQITINGKGVEVAEGSDLHKQLTALMAESGGEQGSEQGGEQGGGDQEAEGEEEEEEDKGQVTKVTTTKTIQNQKDSALQAKVDSQAEKIKELEEGQDARIDSRVELVDRARAICPPTKDDKGNEVPYDHRGKSDAEIMRDVILEVRPSAKARLDAHKGDMSYLRATYDDMLEAAAERVDSSRDLARTIHTAIKGGPKSGSAMLDKVYADHVNDLNGHKKAEGEGK
jgi:hypothetical protein